MAHPLDGCWTKIERAGDHMEELQSSIARYVEENRFSVVTVRDPDTGEYVGRIKANAPIEPPQRMAALVGDALQNLRCVLDYIVWQLVILGGKTPTIQNQFPVTDGPEVFKERANRYLKNVPPKYRTRIEAHQPYQGAPENWWLWALARLNDIDKHRLLLAGVTIMFAEPWESSNITVIKVNRPAWVPCEDGAEVYRATLARSGMGPMRVVANTSYAILFGDADTGMAITHTNLLDYRVKMAALVKHFAEFF